MPKLRSNESYESSDDDEEVGKQRIGKQMHNEIRKILKRKGHENEPLEEDDAEMLD